MSEVKTFPSVCKEAWSGKHEWENVVDHSKPAVQVLPLIWGTYRKIVCTHCGKRRGMKTEDGQNVLEE